MWRKAGSSSRSVIRNGYERDGERRRAWCYRDYVIKAFNDGGLPLVRALCDIKPPVAVIVLTMQSEESTFNAAMDAGAQGYILKENAAEDAVLGLKTVAGGGVYLSPSIAGYLLKCTRRALALGEQKAGLNSLTPTERQVLRLVAENKTNKEIGAELCMSHRTVETRSTGKLIASPRAFARTTRPVCRGWARRLRRGVRS